MNLSCTSPTDASPIHLAGMEYDPETGTYHTLHRQYQVGLGRWLTADPAGKEAVHPDDPQTWNMYAYVRNNPVTLTDPTGESWSAFMLLWPIWAGQALAKSNKQSAASDEAQKQTDTQRVGNIIYNETGGLRPEAKEGSGSSQDLHNGQVAIADVVQNREKAGNYRGVASDKVSSKERNTSQYKDAQQAAAEAARSPGVTGGSVHFYLDYGQRPPSWAAGKQTSTYGPFKNAAGGGDVPKGADVNIIIVHPEDQ